MLQLNAPPEMPQRLRDLVNSLKMSDNYKDVVAAILTYIGNSEHQRLLQCQWEGRQSMPLRWFDISDLADYR